MMSAVTAGGKDLGDRKDEDDHRRDHLQLYIDRRSFSKYDTIYFLRAKTQKMARPREKRSDKRHHDDDRRPWLPPPP
jgi:hypothetical protein